MSGQNILDSAGRESALRDLRKALASLKKPSTAFPELAGLAEFRCLLEADDTAYGLFVQTVARLAAHDPDLTEELEAVEAELARTLAELPGLQTAVKKAGKANTTRIRRAQALAQAPSACTDSYQFSQEEVKPFV